MARLIEKPTVIKAAGEPVKQIEEYIGKVNSHTSELSIARMISPAGWSEPGQQPEFEEYTIVLNGSLQLKFEGSEIVVKAGQAAIVHAGEWVQYSTPEGAEYISVCMPAFSPETVRRDAEW